ncbi:MAG TPA: hypothetical protein ENN22_10890, partial [bacterium]|nr:hypothetical protein [bacterium]
MKNHKFAFLISLVFIFLNASFGNLAAKIVKAKYAGEFLATGVGARALGMGGAFVAVSGDVTGGYWNPAGLTRVDYPQLIAMHSQRFAGLVNYNYGAVAVPVGKVSSLALSVIRLGVDDIPNTTDALLDYGRDGIPNTGDEGEGDGILDENERIDPNRVVYFNSAEYGILLSYATKRNANLSWGANVKLLKKGIGKNSAWGMGFDLAALWQPSQRWQLGFNLQDVTTTLLVWDTGRQEAIIPTIKLGGAFY